MTPGTPERSNPTWYHFDPRAFGIVAGLLSLSTSACNKEEPSSNPAPSASASASAPRPPVAPLASGIVLPREQIEKVVNPTGEKAYSGPTGKVVGSVVMAGDDAVELEEASKLIPADCLLARERYSRPFREGMLRSVADVFIAVTGYEGYVPVKEDVKVIPAKGCAFDTRTVALTYGQALDIVSKDERAYVPELLGARSTAQLVATPGGKPVRLYPNEPGRYVLVDSLRTFAQAEVLVVKYSTYDVTRVDGRFEIDGVPVGKVKVDALLPSTMATAHQEVTVRANKATEVEFTLNFDKAAWDEARKAQQKAKDTKDKLKDLKSALKAGKAQ